LVEGTQETGSIANENTENHPEKRRDPTPGNIGGKIVNKERGHEGTKKKHNKRRNEKKTRKDQRSMEPE